MRTLFATASLADTAAANLARRHSPSGSTRLVPFARVHQAFEGTGPAFAVRPAHGGRSGDYEVIELTPAELRDLVRAGMLREAALCDEHAATTEAEVARRRADGTGLQRAARIAPYAVEDRATAARLRIEAAGMGLVAATLGEPEQQAQGAAE